jgi:hypothetical protein
MFTTAPQFCISIFISCRSTIGTIQRAGSAIVAIANAPSHGMPLLLHYVMCAESIRRRPPLDITNMVLAALAR